MMDLTSSPCPPCPRAHINFTSAQSLFISPAGMTFGMTRMLRVRGLS